MVVINIDTAKDSHDEIKKTIKFLQHIVGEENSGAHVPESGGFMNMFGEDTPAPDLSIFSADSKQTDDEKDAETLLNTVKDVPSDDQDPVIEIVEYD